MASESVNSDLIFKIFFENMDLPAAICKVVNNGQEFLIEKVNKRGEKSVILNLDDILVDTQDHIGDFSENNQLDINLLKKVWKTGEAMKIPLIFKDGLNNLYSFESNIFKLDSYYIAIVFSENTSRIIAEDKKLESLNKFNECLIPEISQKTGDLKKSENKYQCILENAYDLFFVINTMLDIEYVNEPVSEKLLGYTKKDFVGKKILHFIHPDDQKKALEATKNGIKNGEGTVILRVVDKDGIYHWHEIKGKKFNDFDGIQKVLFTSRDITQRILAEQKLRESEAKYRQLVENAQEGIWAIDKYAYTTFTNQRMAEMLGYTINEMLGKHLFKFMNVDAVKIAKQNLERGKQGISQQYYFEFLRKDGKKIYTSIETSPIFDDESNYIGALACVADITHRKIAEKKLRRSEENYRMIFNESPDYIFLTDPKGNLINANTSLLEKFQTTLDNITGRNVFEFFAGDNYEELIEVVKSIRMGKELKNVEIKVQNKLGELFDIEVSSAPIKKDGHVIQILNIARDITQRKLVEKELKESKLLLERTFNSIKDCIFVLNADNPPKILYLNPVVEEVFGYSQEILVGRDVRLLHVDDNSLKKFQQIIYNRIKSEGFVSNLEYRMKRKNGEIFSTEHYVYELIDDDGERIGWISILSDITERKIAEAKFKELDKIRKDFVYRASHELKTPLTSIYSASQLLINNFDNLNKTQIIEFINMINQGGKRLTNLVRNLLDISGIDSDKLKLKKENVNIIKVLNKCIKDFEFKILHHDLSLRKTLPDKIYLNIDESKIEQLFTNILSNAINYTPPKGEIFVSCKNFDTDIEFEIRDTGVGFTEDEKKLIFKKFGKIERYGKGMDIITEGSGLGLYISKEIMELHSGKIWIESKGRNKGSSFYIRFPK
jgi:PAS domain S-box-containing protein